MLILVFVLTLYSGFTAYGMLRYPYYSPKEKLAAFFTILLLPFVGAYLVNYDMGFRLSKESKRDLLYELPWWSRLGNRSSETELDDD